MSEKKELSRTATVIAKAMYGAMKLLKRNDGCMPFATIGEELPKEVDFTEWEKSPSSDKETKPRWLINMIYYTAEYVKAGMIRKDSGTWYLTADGEKALSLTAEQVFGIAHTAYRQYEKENNKHESIDEDIEDIKELTDEMIASEAERVAQDRIRKRIRAMNPYEFQDLCSALLRGLGYYTPFVAPKGRDGGIDIVAYENAAGVGQRIIVQVKHMPTTSIDVTVVRNLAALLKKDSDTGIVFTSGTFTNEAIRFAREHKSNIRIISSTEFIKLWIEHYELMTEEDKEYLPLKAVHYLAK